MSSPSVSQDPVRCPDCGSVIELRPGHDRPRFCASCGQQLEVVETTLAGLFAEFVSSLTSFERPVLRTFRGILLDPGGTASAWIAGRRRSLLHPVRLLLVVGVATALLHEPLQVWRAAVWESGVARYEVGLARHASGGFALFMLVLLVPIGAATAWVGRRLGLRRGLAEWYVLGCYTYGVAALLQLLWQLLAIALPRLRGGVGSALEFGLPVGLWLFGAVGFVPRSKRRRAVLAALVGVAATMLLLVGFQLLREALDSNRSS